MPEPKKRRKPSQERWLLVKIQQHLAACPECQKMVYSHFAKACLASLDGSEPLKLGAIRERRPGKLEPEGHGSLAGLPGEAEGVRGA